VCARAQVPATGGAAAAASCPLVTPLMVFDGCPRAAGVTLLLRGGDAATLQRVKVVTKAAVYAALAQRLENALLADTLASAVASMRGDLLAPRFPGEVLRGVDWR
jgi:hypothetical protein